MNLNKEQINKIKELSALFFSPEDIAIFMDLDYQKLKHIILFVPESEISIAYKKGKLETKHKIRTNIIKFAVHGSPQAQEIVKNYISTQEAKEK